MCSFLCGNADAGPAVHMPAAFLEAEMAGAAPMRLNFMRMGANATYPGYSAGMNIPVNLIKWFPAACFGFVESGDASVL